MSALIQRAAFPTTGDNHHEANVPTRRHSLLAIDAALDQLEEALVDLIALDKAARRRLFKMGNKSEAFCRQALTVLDKNRQVAPASLELDEALAALATIDQLRPRNKRILWLAERMRDSELALGADVAKAARKGYAMVRINGENQGLDGLHTALSKRFSRRPRRTADEANEDQAA